MELAARLRGYPLVAVLSDSVKPGGFGAQLLAAWAGYGTKPALRDFAFPDAFIPQGTREELFKRYSLDEKSIANKIINVIGKG
jgi:1-deoxy-D-xylulose-5-phosphate synthase